MPKLNFKILKLNLKTAKLKKIGNFIQVTKINSIPSWCNQQKILLKTKFSYMSVMKTTLKMQNFNLSMPIIHLKIQKLNLTQQKLNLKILKLKKTCKYFRGCLSFSFEDFPMEFLHASIEILHFLHWIVMSHDTHV